MLKLRFNISLAILLLSLTALPVQAAPAPDILIHTAKSRFHLKELRGKVVYLDFWASWCIPCRESFPWMNRMEKKYSKNGLRVIAINLDENRAQAEAFLRRYPAHFTVGFDAAGKSAEIYDLKGMPSSYLIDRQGNIIASHVGFRKKDMDKLEAGIRSALRQQVNK